MHRRPALVNNNLWEAVIILKVSLARTTFSRKQVLSSQMGRASVCLRRVSSRQWKLAHHANATNRPLGVWFKRKGQTKAEHFSVVFSHRLNVASISSGPTSQFAHQVTSNRGQSLLQVCHLHPLAIATICVCPCVCVRRDQTQADGFSNARSRKVRHASSSHGLTNR